MITSIESKAENVREELPTEKFLLESPFGNGLAVGAALSVTNQDSGFALEPIVTAQERASVSSFELLSQLAKSAKRNLLRFPGSARAHANLGAAYLKAGNLRDAEHALSTALEVEPNHYLASMTLAKLFTEQGKTAEAESIYKGLIAAGCSEVLVPVNLANIAINKGDYTEAAAIIQGAVSLPPTAKHFVIGLLRMHGGNHREAIKELKAALRTDIRNPQLNHALGIAYSTAGDQRKAEKHLRSALALDPHNPATVRALGTVLLENKSPEKAVELIHVYLEKHSSDWTARELLGRCYLRMSKWQMAKSQFKLVLVDQESIPRIELAKLHCNLAVVEINERNYREAEKELTRSLNLDNRSSPIPYENYARVLMFGMRNNPRALEMLHESKRIFPASVATRLLLSSGYSREGQNHAALNELLPIYSADSSPEVCAQIGMLYEAIGEISMALSVLRAAFLKYPTHMSVINNLAYTLLAVGEIDEARLILRSLPNDADLYPEIVATQGLLRLSGCDLDSARRLYKRAEGMAKKGSDKDLVKRVRQKTHLELAKYFIRTGDLAEAKKHVSFSRLENVRFYSAAEEIEKVSQFLESR